MTWLKNHFKLVLLYVLVWILLMISFTSQLSYYIFLPGGIESAQNFVTIENAYPSSGTFNSTYVSVVTKPSPFQYLLAKLNSKAEFYKMGPVDSQLPLTEMSQTDQLDKLSSIDNAVIEAYNAAGQTLNYKADGLVIERRNLYIKGPNDTTAQYVSFKAFDVLKVGDIIQKANGQTITDYDDMRTAITDVGCDSPISLTVLRDNKEVPLTVEKTYVESEDACMFGISTAPENGFTQDGNTYTHYSFDNNTSNPQFSFADTSGYGPSAGLLQTLSIYNMITSKDITYGLTIAGTGTINESGIVGPIGGITQKVYGACNAKTHVDIFFTPNVTGYNNYEDALKAKETMKCDIQIVPVNTFQDAVDYLNTNYGNAD